MANNGGTTKSGGAEAAKGPAPSVTFRMRQILHLMPEGVLLLDRAGRILELNTMGSELLDRPAHVLRGEELERLFVGAFRVDGRPFLVEDLPGRRALLSGVPQTGVVMRFERPGQPALWLEVNAVPLGSIEQDGPVVLVSFRDISEHRRADDAVRFQAGLLDAAAEAIIATDEHLHITYCNAGTESLLQRTRNETIGQSASTFIAPHRADDIERIEHLLKAGLVIRDFETIVRRADGTDLDVSLSVTAQTDERGVPNGAIAIIRDISERVRAAREASLHARRAADAERQAALEAMDRIAAERANEAKSQLLSKMSHELRTPLNVVLGFAQLLEDAELTDPADRRSVGQILQAGARLLELVDEVLEFTRRAEVNRRSGRPDASTIDLDDLGVAGGRTPQADPPPPARRRDDRDFTILYVDDDLEHLRAVEALVATRDDVDLVTTASGRWGIELARDLQPDLMLISSGLTGLTARDVLAELRMDVATGSTCVMVVNAVAAGCPADHPSGDDLHEHVPALDLGRLLTIVDGLAHADIIRVAA